MTLRNPVRRPFWHNSITLLLAASLAALGCDDGSEDVTTIGGEDAGAGGAGAGGGAGGGGTGGSTGGDPGGGQTVACNDGEDNDGDGAIDLDDPGCDAPGDPDETDPPATAGCADGEDNDQDGFIDYPEDPGCASEFDDTEENPPTSPQCGDAIDNDRDGFTDEEDPGCASAADPNETDPEPRPQCSDGVDNDGDGRTDFPLELGCITAGDDDEIDPPTPPACANGIDDDNDMLIDYPNDPGCAGAGDREEAERSTADGVPLIPACGDGDDNDGDGKIDYPEDEGCSAAADYSERGTCGDAYSPAALADGASITFNTSRGVFTSEGSCGGRGGPEVVFQYRLDRNVEALVISTANEGTEALTTLYVRKAGCLDADAEIACQSEAVGADQAGQTLVLEAPTRGDYFIFVDSVTGQGGQVRLTVEERPLAECLNGIDDNGDGTVDYPEDPGCESPIDRSEELVGDPPACSNGMDDDGDMLTDFPADRGCVSAGADDEVDRCGQGVRFEEVFFGVTRLRGNTAEGTTAAGGSCGGDGVLPEVIFHYFNPFNQRLTFSTRNEETQGRYVVYVRQGCNQANTELACDAGLDQEPGMEGVMGTGEVTIEQAAVGDYWIFVDTFVGVGGEFVLTVEGERLDPGCRDGLDNDADGLFDADDPGCENGDDEDERDPPAGVVSLCNNTFDDDEDGLPDYPQDPGCETRGDNDEGDPEPLPACSNGLDDDEDGLPDFPLDAGCQSRGDPDEQNVVPPPECGNRFDDDDDGLADYPLDPGCDAAGDTTERDPVNPPVCANDIDDDRDGVADFPFDAGCIAASDFDETDPPADELPQCSDGVDNDGDMVVDFPLDNGCRYAADNDETSPGFPQQCSNGRDDDADGRADFPDDPGCRFAADQDEVNPGFLPPRCADGVDNDFDGAIDLQDLGCLDNEDDDEDDPAEVPLCGNEMDDDGDELADWPADPGCQARGDLTEDQSCRPEVNTPLIPRNGTVMGSTVEGGADVYKARCGGREAPEAVYRYVLEEQADLVISADNPGTDFPPVVYVRNDCEEPESFLGCGGFFAQPNPVVELRDAEPGEYFIFVDGGGPERFLGGDGQIAMPPDPRNFVARQDVNNNCWSDGGNDAFDCYGRLSVSHAGQRVENLNIVPGPTRPGNAGGYAFNLDMSWAAQGVLRYELTPTVEFDDRPVTVQITGNLGSDGSTVNAVREVEFEGRTVPYLNTSDNFAAPRDPPVVHLMVPSDPEEWENVMYSVARDNPTVTATDVKLPLTFYLAIHYGDSAAVARALLSDLQIEAGPGGDDAPRFGNFELSVTENP
jgi:hypothetical protein